MLTPGMVLILSIILIAIVLIALIFLKYNIPLIIIALSVGIIFGSDVTGIIYFDNAVLAQEVADIALIFILFAGGFGIKSHHFKTVLRPTLLLATVGVLTTSIITALIFSFLSGWPFVKSALLCSIISSTDAAAVFSILRSRPIKKEISSIVEIESASNDPMAIISTTFLIQAILGANVNTHMPIFHFFWQLIGGAAIGILIGFIGSFLFQKIKELDVGYFYLSLIAIILLSYGLAGISKTSGMISVFFTGYILGNKKLPYKNGISSFTESLSFISNVGLFVLLGLLVFPRNFPKIWTLGVILFFVITFISRPLTVLLCTMFTKISIKDKIFISWSGIRGAVPIVLATYPMAAGIDSNHEIFNIIFFTVVLSVIIQGSTIGKLADILKLSYANSKRRVDNAMELITTHETNYELIELYIDDNVYQGECKISDLSLPPNTTITMINRSDSVIAPTGQTIIYPGDTLFILVDENKKEECANAILRAFSQKG